MVGDDEVMEEHQQQQELFQAEQREQKLGTEGNELLGKIIKMEQQEQKEEKEEEAKEEKQWLNALIDQMQQLKNDQQKQIEELGQQQMGQFEHLKNHFYERLLVMEEEQEEQKEETEKKWHYVLADQIKQLQNAQKKEICDLEGQLKRHSHEQLVSVQNELLAKIAKVEREQQQKEAEDKKWRNALVTQMSQLENDQKQIGETVGQMKLILHKNWWDVNVCHGDLEIIGPKCSVVHYKANGGGWRSVFAKNPISCNDSGIFYFEMTVEKKRSRLAIGLATKEMPLDKCVGHNKDSYGHRSNGTFWVNDAKKFNILPPTFSAEDVVGFGINLTNRRIFFTKNGRLLALPDFLDFTIFLPADSLFPCVSLYYSEDKIVTNFGPHFKFNIGSL